MYQDQRNSREYYRESEQPYNDGYDNGRSNGQRSQERTSAYSTEGEMQGNRYVSRDFHDLDAANVDYNYDRRDEEQLMRRQEEERDRNPDFDTGRYRKPVNSNPYTGRYRDSHEMPVNSQPFQIGSSVNRRSDLERIAVEGFQDREEDTARNYREDYSRSNEAFEMRELPQVQQRLGARKRREPEPDTTGNQNRGFDLEPDYEHDVDSSDSNDGPDNLTSGFDRISRYYGSDEDVKQSHSRDAESFRQSTYTEGELYEEIQPVSLYVGATNNQETCEERHDAEHNDSDSNESLYNPRHYGKFLRKMSSKRIRNRRKSEHTKSYYEYNPSNTLSFKTLVGRRKAISMYVKGDKMHKEDEVEPDYEDLEDVGLPSSKMRQTVKLSERYQKLQKSHNATSHDMATLLRDRILSNEPSLPGFSLWKYQVAMQWLSFKNWSKNWIYELELWAGHFKQIEGHFGTATMSYFRFLRWLMFLNLFMALFMILVILLPFLLLKPLGDHNFPSQVNKCLSNEHYYAWYLSTNYTNRVKTVVEAESEGQYVLDVLQGTGWLENTELFYGIYYNKTATVPGGGSYTYNMSLAYLMAVGAGFLLSFILLVKNSAKGLKENRMASGGSSITLFCNKVFGAWDYCISLDKTARLKQKNLRQDLLNELEYQRLQWKKDHRTAKERFKLYGIRVLVNAVVLAVLSFSLYLIYYTNQKLLEYENNTTLSDMVLLSLQYLPSITITVLNVIIPLVFNKVVLAEDYMPAFRTRITLTRTVLLRLASVGILMYSLYYTLMHNKKKHQLDSDCANLQLANSTTEGFSVPCWETYVGQQIYKLVILNFIVSVLVTFIWEYPRKLMFDKFHEKVKVVNLLGQQQFDLSKCVLDLIYLQALCWLGMFFSPIIPAMCFVKLFIFFYVKKGSLLRNCEPVQQYGTSRSNSLFMMVLLMAFALAAIPITVMVGTIPPSKGCGPFRIYSSEDYVMFDVVSNMISSWEGLRHVLFFVGQGGVLVCVGFLLCLLMYYFYIMGQAHHNMTKTLREQLKVEGQDKKFLLERVNEALEWEEKHEEEDGS